MSISYPAWHFFATVQNTVDPLSIDRSWARDEALDAVLDDVASNQTQSESLVQKRFYSLCRNRLSKQKHRRKLQNHQTRPTHRRAGRLDGNVTLVPPARNVVDEIAYEQLTDVIRTVLPEEDLQLLVEIADGQSYADMARERDLTVSALKARAFRVREKIRKSRISSTLRCWPRR